MKRVVPILFFLLLVSVVTGVMMTGGRAELVRAEIARRARQGSDGLEPTTESA